MLAHAPVPDQQTIHLKCEWCGLEFAENFQYWREHKNEHNVFYCTLKCKHEAKEHFEWDTRGLDDGTSETTID